jgi:hypothetical protein
VLNEPEKDVKTKKGTGMPESEKSKCQPEGVVIIFSMKPLGGQSLRPDQMNLLRLPANGQSTNSL